MPEASQLVGGRKAGANVREVTEGCRIQAEVSPLEWIFATLKADCGMSNVTDGEQAAHVIPP